MSRHYSFNHQFIGLTLALLAFGLVMLTSASQVIGLDDFKDPFYYIKHQLIFGVLPGLLCMILASHIPYRLYEKYAIAIFAGTVILLILIFIPGIGFTHAGASRWLAVLGISVQPSEIMKLALVIFLSSWFAKRKDKTNDFYYTFVPFLLILGAVSLLIALQPDLGTLGVVIAIAISIYWIAEMRRTHLLIFVFVIILGFGILIKAAPYRLSRISAYLNPREDQLGASYQINQSLIGIGSGGILGRGIGQSKQKYHYLPEVAGDSIFAVIAEELGFIGTSGFIIFYLYFIIHGFRLGKRALNPFGKYMICGIMSWFASQMLINIGAMVGLLPLTGLPLPFVSYGSSALIVTLSGIGVVMNVSISKKS
ncbi:MAG: cell division protein FtsW [Candidatus Jacksonbacteria bacterium RIFCSPHIGHO2_02_FULL_44_25]|nr:MAG: cell division protein FtsW [Candidatus Jacksonbacteria bacterium RIFCSPHIGHO2_02_FULL_44_25]